MKPLFLFFLLLTCGFLSVPTVADTFNPATNILTLDSVRYKDQKYSNVVLRIDQFTVLSVGSSVPVNSDTCGLERFTAANFDAIQVGMSLDQVTQIMGCLPGKKLSAPGGIVSYSWSNLDVTQMLIIVSFDESSMKVTGFLGPSFKFWQGRDFVGQ